LAFDIDSPESKPVLPAQIGKRAGNNDLRANRVTNPYRSFITHVPGQWISNFIPYYFRLSVAHDHELAMLNQNPFEFFHYIGAKTRGGRVKIGDRYPRSRWKRPLNVSGNLGYACFQCHAISRLTRYCRANRAYQYQDAKIPYKGSPIYISLK
jgi:hypothetical protein